MLPPRIRRFFRLAVRRTERLEADVGDEIAFHLEQRIEQLMARGLSADAARLEAVRRFGHLERAQTGITRSAQRREDQVEFRQRLDSLRHDLRYTLRAIRTSPGFTAVVVVTLGLGIGANTAIFGVIDAVVLSPLPYREPSRLVVLGDAQAGDELIPASFPEFVDWKARSGSVFTTLGAYFSSELTLTGAGEPEMLSGVRASLDLPRLLGTAPIHGRWFSADEELRGSERVVLVSEELWNRRFGRDAEVLGKVITLNGNPHTIVGVMPSHGSAVLPGDLVTGERRDLWVPLRLDAEVAPRGLHFMTVLGQLRPEIDLTVARARMEGIAGQLRKDGVTQHGVYLASATERIVGNVRARLGLLLGAVALVLLIACANVANLLLGRAAYRQRDIAVRMALGAGRGRVARQLILESVIRALMGGLLGIAIAYVSLSAARKWLPSRLPRADEIGIDGRVLLFALVVSVLTGLIFGVLPALRAASHDIGGIMREGARGLAGSLRRDRVRTTLVVAEIALSFVLLANAGLLLGSFGRLSAVDTGFDDERTLSALLILPPSRYADSLSQIAFFDRLLENVGVLPGIRAIALTSNLPVEGGTNGGFSIEGMTFPEDDQPIAEKRIVSANYFEMLGARLVEGRAFDNRDRLGAPTVMVINESFARKWFPEGSAVGKRVAFSWGIEGMQTVIGVVADIREGALDQPAAPAMYVPVAQRASDAMNVLVRATGDPMELVPAVRKAVLALDPDMPITQVRTLDDVVASRLAGPRLSATLLAIFSMVALFLAAIGLYAVISFSVLQRTREIGIRAALGAQRRDILRLVLGQGAGLVVVGLTVGLLIALALGRLMASQLFGIAPDDPATFSLVAVVLAFVALMAAALPAVRATRVDPMHALRQEN